MHLRIMTEPQRGADYGRLLAVARATEQLGFDAFFRSDHYLRMEGGNGLPGPTDAWLTLAGLALQTSRIRLGTLVSPVTFRYPGPLAVSVAQADAMSGGRIELGLGAGWYAAEHSAYAIPFPDTRERFGMLEEQLAIITGLWDAPPGQAFSFAGQYYQVSDSPGLPKPAQRPHPPILLGGTGRTRTPRLAARYAAEFNVPFASMAETGAAFGRVRDACRAAGRDPGSVTYSAAQTLCCGRDDAEVRRRAAAIGREPDALRSAGLAGTPAEVAAKIGQFAALGASRMYLQVLDLHDLDQLELVAAEVMPQVR